MTKKLSFDITDPKQFNLFIINDFRDLLDEDCIHYLFSHGPFLFWVNTVEGKVKDVAPSDRGEAELWEAEHESGVGSKFTDEQFETHEADAEILNTPEYIEKLQAIIDAKQKSYGF